MSIGKANATTRFLEALDAGRRDEAQSLLDSGIDVDGFDYKNGHSLLAGIAMIGDSEILQKALRAGASPDGTPEHRKRSSIPLVAASREGKSESVRILLDAGANPNVFVDDCGPAHFDAAARGHPDILQLLIDAGADISLENCWGQTALSQAERSRRLRISRGQDPASLDETIAMLSSAGEI